MNLRLLNSDVNLIRSLRKSDNTAFEFIFNKYKKKLYYFTFNYVHSSAESEEIIQNVFISFWESRESLNENYPLQNFLYKITINHIFNYFKHKAVRQKYVDYISLQDSQEDDHVHQDIFFDDLKDALDNYIDELPAKQQEIFKLSRNEGLSHTEIADHLGLSVRSVENQIYRALKVIREKLRKEYLLTE